MDRSAFEKYLDANRRYLTKGNIDYVEDVAEMSPRLGIKGIKELLSSFDDELTGIPSRRIFDSDLEFIVGLAARASVPSVLMLFDMDSMKTVNDTAGHDYGDLFLKSVADKVSTHVKRKYERFARVGGDEFGIILPNTELERGMKLADKIRNDLNRNIFLIERNDEYKVVSFEDGGDMEEREDMRLNWRVITSAGASFGVACTNQMQNWPSSEELYSITDRAMYKSKQSTMKVHAHTLPGFRIEKFGPRRNHLTSINGSKN